MEMDTLRFGKFFHFLRGDSLILVPHLCEDSTEFLPAPLACRRGVYLPGFVFFCFFDHEVSSATVSAFSQAGLLSSLRAVNTTSDLR